MGMPSLRPRGAGDGRAVRGDPVECLPAGENQGADVAFNRPGRWPVGIAYLSLTSHLLMDASEGGIQERRAPCVRFAPGVDSVLDGVY